MRIQEKGSCLAQASCTSFNAPKRNHLYALRSRGEQEESPDVVTGMYKSSLLILMIYLIPMLNYNFLLLYYLNILIFYSMF